MMVRWVLGLLVALCLFAGCTIRGNFYSKSGRTYPQVAHRAVILGDAELDAVMSRGAFVIGKVDAQSIGTMDSVDDVNVKAAEIAAEAGGTHILITRAGMETYTRHHPATETRNCRRTEAGRECVSTYEPAGTSSYEKPSGEYVVLRLETPQWGYLPIELQPMP